MVCDVDRLWGRYWIEGGIDVIHRNMVTDLNIDRLGLFRMTVDKVLKRSKDGGVGVRRVYIEGVRCHWLDGDMKYQVGMFHTNELIPYDVAVKGKDEVNRWILRDLR